MAPIKGRSAVRHARLQARQPVFPVPARRSDASLSVAAASRRSSATSHIGAGDVALAPHGNGCRDARRPKCRKASAA